jgi:hypothetical protein
VADDQRPEPVPPVLTDILCAAAELSLEATRQVALFKVVQLLPNDDRKATVLREITKRLAAANKAFAAVLEGYSV